MDRYTAQDIREAADNFWVGGVICEVKDESGRVVRQIKSEEVIAMLRQAADEQKRLDSILDAIEKEFKKQSTCRSCEWRGKSIRSEPACPCDNDENFSVYEIDIIDRLRQAADGTEQEEKREKKYEYAAMYEDGEVSGLHYVDIEPLKHGLHSNHRMVRREVGEWEEVDR